MGEHKHRREGELPKGVERENTRYEAERAMIGACRQVPGPAVGPGRGLRRKVAHQATTEDRERLVAAVRAKRRACARAGGGAEETQAAPDAEPAT